MKIIEQPEDQVSDKYNEKEIKLENIAMNPFHKWSDWYNKENKAVITFITMDSHLYSKWESQCIDNMIYADAAEIQTQNSDTPRPAHINESVTIFNHSNFENNFDGPGIYLDDTHYDNDEYVDESYTIILPRDFMTREMCEEWIKALNTKYNRNFKLDDTDYNQRRNKHIINEIKADEEIPQGIREKDLKKIIKHVQKNIR